MPDVSGVGISFGADRIYDVMTELHLFPEGLERAAQVLFINFGEREQTYCVSAAAQLRAAGVSTLIYPDAVKMKKQMEFANRRQIPYVVFVGENEIATQSLTVKNMKTGEQRTMPLNQAIGDLAEMRC